MTVSAIVQFLKVYRFSYDAYTHIFFADHYRRNWFSLWDQRWYGGFSVATYPPLTHQLTALLSFTLGVENAYQAMSIISAVALTFSVYLYSKIFIREDEAASAALIAALLPAAGLILNAFGQLPTILSTALALTAAHEYDGYLSKASLVSLVEATLWTVTAGLAHHFTFLFFVPLAILPILVKHIKAEGKVTLRKTIPYVVITSFLLLIILSPFVASILKATTSVEIPHATRENFFAGLWSSMMFFWGMYSFTILLVPNAVAIVFRRRELLPLFAVFVGLFVLGLGGVTPIPKMILGSLWYVLTYDRFAFWAAIVLTLFLGIMLKDVDTFVKRYYNGDETTSGHPRNRVLLTSAFLAGLFVSYGLSSGAVIIMGLQPVEFFDDHQVDEMAKFLDINSQWRYITLGFGNQRLLLNSKTTAETLDGGYNLAKTQPLLTESGVDNIDGTKYFPNGIQFLEKILSQESNKGLKYVLSADSYYDPILRDYGLQPIFTIEGTRKVMVWEIPYAQKNIPSSSTTDSLTAIAWSTGPMITLVIAMILTGFRRKMTIGRH